MLAAIDARSFGGGIRARLPFRSNLIVPRASDFPTVVGSPAPTITDKVDRMVLNAANSGLAIRVIKMPVLPTPYTVEMCCAFLGAGSTTDGPAIGLALSNGTAHRVLWQAYTTAGSIFPRLAQLEWTSTTGASNVFALCGGTYDPGMLWFRITDDGGTRQWFQSHNGHDWTFHNSEANTAGFTATQVGIVIYNSSVAAVGTPDAKASIYHFLHCRGVLGDDP